MSNMKQCPPAGSHDQLVVLSVLTTRSHSLIPACHMKQGCVACNGRSPVCISYCSPLTLLPLLCTMWDNKHGTCKVHACIAAVPLTLEWSPPPTTPPHSISSFSPWAPTHPMSKQTACNDHIANPLQRHHKSLMHLLTTEKIKYM